MLPARITNLVIALFLSSVALSQTNPSQMSAKITPEQVKATALKTVWLERIAKDTAGNLKLAENRAFVYSRLGHLYWKIDPTCARELFDQAIAEFIIAEREAESDRNRLYPSASFLATDTRWNILHLIVQDDERLAFEMFLKSRPEAVHDILAGAPLSPRLVAQTSGGEDLPAERNVILRENEIEQRLAYQIANSSPESAIGIFKRDNDPPAFVGTTTYNLLKLLGKTRPLEANAILRGLLARVLAADFASNPDASMFASQFLADSLPQNKSGRWFQTDDQVIRQLAEKEADFLIRNAVSPSMPAVVYIASARLILLQLLPERAAQLNDRSITSIRSLPIFGAGRIAFSPDIQEILNTASVDRLLGEAEKYPPVVRDQFYVTAADRSAAGGDIDRAKQILAGHFSSERLSDLYDDLYLKLIRQAAEKKDYERAVELIEQAGVKLRYPQLIDLAVKIHADSPEENQRARTALEKASRLIPAIPVTSDDFGKFGQLAAAYALVDPKIGFRMLEIIIKKLNEISTSTAKVDSFYQASSMTLKDEYLLNSYNIRIRVWNMPVKNFARTDLVKALQILDEIRRPEIRINFQLRALEGFNSEVPTPNVSQ